jgi:hypothetical protein
MFPPGNGRLPADARQIAGPTHHHAIQAGRRAGQIINRRALV